MTLDSMGGSVGELTLVDASLSALLEDMRRAMTEYGPAEDSSPRDTTGRLADEMLRLQKAHPRLISRGIRDWLKRTKRAAEERNKVVHAIGRDRCVRCGRSTQFEHRGKQVDRSEEKISDLIAEIGSLIDEGVQLADDMSARINERLVEQAGIVARITGQPQGPAQIKIASSWHHCGDCSDSARTATATTIAVPAGVMVIPPGTDLRGLFDKTP